MYFPKDMTLPVADSQNEEELLAVFENEDLPFTPAEEEMILELFKEPEPICIGCGRHPSAIEEYWSEFTKSELDPAQYVRENEGTFNPFNGHFACSECYILMGMPSSPQGWIAP